MKIQFTQKFIERIPNVREGLLLISNLNNSYNSDHSYQFLCKSMDEARLRSVQQKDDKMSGIIIWEEAFDKLGYDSSKNKPSHIQLLSRVLEQQDLPNINPIVNIINAVQIKHLLPIGAHDLDKAEGDISLTLACTPLCTPETFAAPS